jgi:phosphoglycolate phosphatase
MKAVLFDLDGTLLNTLYDIGNAMNNVLKRRGFREHDIQKYKYFVGEGMAKLVERALPSGHGAGEADSVLVEMRKEYLEHCMDNTVPYSGIPEILSKLSASGIRMTVFSNKPHAMTVALVAKNFPMVKFDSVNGARDNIPLKPDPAGALDAARNMFISPDEFVYVGDSKTDMITANAAGMYPVGALWGFRGADELLEYGARSLIKSPDELWDIVNMKYS